jgi:hypothetical protein
MKIFGTILLLLFSHNLISACTCQRLDEKARIEALRKMDAVFYGKVVSISEPFTKKWVNSKGKVYYEQPYVKVKFKVFRAWKGVESDTVIVENESGTSSCSLGYKIGQTDYVAADGKPLSTHLCSRSNIDPEKFNEIFGAEKVFQAPIAPQSTQENEPAQSFWSKMRSKIFSFFS